jgi:hypothetical protein
MSKNFRLRAAICFAALFISLALVTGPTRTRAQQSSATTRVAPTNTRTAAVVAATAEVLKETSEIRELSILRPVKSGAQSRAEIESMIIRNMNEETTPEDTHSSEVALKKLGLVPPDFEFRPFIVKLLTEQVAGYYDPKAQQFYLADWIDLDGQKPVMAHELTHALQDQHFNLRRFDKWPKGDSDAEMAAHALIEGDATLAMIRYVTRDLKRAVAFAKSIGADSGSSEQIDKAPRALRESLLFPYSQGTDWVTNLYKRGGWTLVSGAFTDLPQSTEQILHAEKYLAREAPVKIDMPNVSASLGSGWKRIDYDVNGEWGYYLILNQFLKSGSAEAAAGWGGDRFAVYEEAKTGQVFIAQLSAWDNKGEAEEFYRAYQKRTLARYSNITEISVAGLTDISTGSSEGKAWRTEEGLVLIYWNGERVLVLEGVPEKANVPGLLETLASIKVRNKRAA